MKLGISGLWAVVGLLMAGTSLPAHHSVQAEFDLNKPLTMTGVVTKVEWINPHSYLYLDVKDDGGNLKHWAFEMAGPGALRRAGLSRADRGGLKAGDTVTINAVAAKDGTDSGLIKDVTLPDGRKFTIWTSDPNAK
jgi:Family of unknown function (DUF6152)